MTYDLFQATTGWLQKRMPEFTLPLHFALQVGWLVLGNVGITGHFQGNSME